jgi:LacI family transcriptional regulator
MVSPTREQVHHVVAANPQNPVMLVDASCINAHPKVHCRCIDHRNVARLAVKHLAEVGHRAIGYVGGGDHLANGREHWEGYAAACREFAVPVVPQHNLRSRCWRLAEPELQTLTNILSSPQRPTAFYATGYSFAIDLYHAAAAANLNIPRDLSVVGVDDAPGASHLDPPLTTLREPLLELGRASVRVLFELIHGQIPTLQHQCVCAELIARKSTAVPAAP